MLRSQINSKELVKTAPFKIDNLVLEYERQLFKIHPPPPPPVDGPHYVAPDVNDIYDKK